jgi:hypothetical protein
MENKIKIDSVQMVRKVRDEHFKRLIGKSHQEIIDFYKKEAEKTISKINQAVSRVKKVSTNLRIERMG